MKETDSALSESTIMGSKERIRVVLVFRSKDRKGKSIEGLFQPFLDSKGEGIEFIEWEYDLSKSVISNIISMRKCRGDIWHVTGDINFMILALWGKKSILTIHDIGRFKELTGLKRWVYGKCWIEWPIRWANYAHTVSSFTRNDILKYFKHPSMRKLQVIHNSYSPVFTRTDRMQEQDRPKILQVGTAVHKNLDTLIKSCKDINCELHIVGELSALQLKTIREYQVDFKNYVDISEAQLFNLYKQCDLVVFASLHEGFGMPIVEAQAIGRPVITTRMASIPEVAGSGVHFLADPMNDQELKMAILKILKDEEYRTLLVEKGYMNAGRFTWKGMRNAYFEQYKHLFAL